MDKMLLSESEIMDRPNNMELGDYVRRKFEAQKKEEFDRCVLCGKVSPYKRSTHIDCRLGYIEGAGQGCFQSKFCNTTY